MPDQKIGDILDGLGVTADLDDGDLISGAVVIIKIVPPDGPPALILGADESTDWITQRGMVETARDIVRCGGDGVDE